MFSLFQSHIPKPLTEELVKAQNEKKREKNRKMKQKIKEKREKEKEEEDRLRFLQLSDREKVFFILTLFSYLLSH